MLLNQNAKKITLGLTLLELVVSLSLFAILLCLSFSFAPSLYKKNKLQVVSNEVKGAIQHAKLQALLTGETLVLARLPGAREWSSGMVLFVDNGSHQCTSVTKILHEWHWHSSEIQDSWHGFQSQDYLLFSPDMSRNTVNGSFEITNSIKQKIKLVVNRLGRIKEDI